MHGAGSEFEGLLLLGLVGQQQVLFLLGLVVLESEQVNVGRALAQFLLRLL